MGTMDCSIGIKISQSSIPLHLCDRLTANILHPEIQCDYTFFVRFEWHIGVARVNSNLFRDGAEFPHSAADRWHIE